MLVAQPPAKRRLGCFTRLLVTLGLALGFMAVFTAVVSPWSYFLGGHFHLLPMWRGWGRMHLPAGDYVLFTEISSRPGGRRVSHLTGNAVLCAPDGRTYRLRILGDFRKDPGFATNVDGQPLYLSIGENLNFLGTNQNTRLGFELNGAWHNPDLVMDDRGSIARAFNPEGTLYTGDPRKRPATGTPLPITLHEGSRSEFDAACSERKGVR